MTVILEVYLLDNVFEAVCTVAERLNFCICKRSFETSLNSVSTDNCRNRKSNVLNSIFAIEHCRNCKN